MPTTYNGIGTRYYGQKNAQSHPGACKFCNRQVQLKSYDTRLWFVVVYIPVIPLGRKRIIDYCPSCRRHYVTPLHKWETAKQLSVSGALQEFHQDPTPDNAIHVHQQLIGFRQYTEAAEFRKIMEPQFHDNARVQLYLGEELSALGQRQEALLYYRRALELRPDMPQANVGVARDLIQQGKLDEARRLLSFLEQPGAKQLYSLEPIETLANAYQRTGRHAEALALFGLLLKELPTVAQHESFRKRVKTSEKALNSKPSILPKKKFSFRGMFSRKARGGSSSGKAKLIGAAAVVFIIALVMAGTNEYTRRHRTLYIVNGFEKPATVTIDGIGDFHVGRTQTSVTLPEGKWHAHITGPIDQNVDFEIVTGYMSRWGDSHTWLLNVGGAALLQEEHGHYSKEHSVPSDYDFIYGAPFVVFAQMDHPFEDLPSQISVDSNDTSSKTLTNLIFYREKPVNAVAFLADKGRFDEAMRMAQWDLKLHPEDLTMLYTYSGLSTEKGSHAQFVKFLQDGLSIRPVAVEWHRLYQENVKDTPSGTDNLIAAYDAMLAKEPGNSALLYLRGRIAKTRQEGLDFFNRSLKADPKNAYAYYALGYDAMARGEWQEALPILSHAVEFGGDVPSFWKMYNDARFATGDYAGVEKDARAQLQKNPYDGSSALDLVLALVAGSRIDEAEKAVTNYESSLRKGGELDPDQSLRAAFLYATNKQEEIEKLRVKDADDKVILCYALMELGKPDEAEKIMPVSGTQNDNPFFDIAMATTWMLKGDAAHATPWLDGATKNLQASGDADLIHIGKILTDSAPPSLDEMKTLIISPEYKALLAAYLALRHPDQAAAFADMAGHFNIGLVVPHNLVAQVVAKARPAP